MIWMYGCLVGEYSVGKGWNVTYVQDIYLGFFTTECFNYHHLKQGALVYWIKMGV